jgi:hypothetical protein
MLDDELQRVRQQLLSPRPAHLRSDQGGEAFQQHRILVTTIHQATMLDQHGSESQTRAWVRYFADYFPAPRNNEADAGLLWKQWRVSLLKIGAPGPDVLVTHGQPHAHWHRADDGRLCIDLESMWDDFTWSVDRFLDFLRSDRDRAAVVIPRAQQGRIEIVTFSTLSTASAYATGGPVATASAAVAVNLVEMPRKPPET